jgi:hypothetical protein
MKRLFLTLSLLLALALPAQAFAAIAFGASLGTASAGSGTSISKGSLSISGTNLALLFWVATESNNPTVSSMNWDDGSGGSAQAFTQVSSYRIIDTNANIQQISLWGLAAPNASNSRVIVNLSGTSNSITLGGVYYTGVAQSSAFTTGSAGNTTGVASYSQADTSDTDGSWHVGITGDNNGTITMGANTTNRVGIGAFSMVLVDSNATVANGVSHTFNWNQSVGGAREAWVSAMMRPFTVAAATWQAQTYVLIQDWEN